MTVFTYKIDFCGFTGIIIITIIIIIIIIIDLISIINYDHNNSLFMLIIIVSKKRLAGFNAFYYRKTLLINYFSTINCHRRYFSSTILL